MAMMTAIMLPVAMAWMAAMLWKEGARPLSLQGPLPPRLTRWNPFPRGGPLRE